MLEKSRFDVLDDYLEAEIVSYSLNDEEPVLDIKWLNQSNIGDNMMIRSRPTYPSDKMTFNFANLTRNKKIHHIAFSSLDENYRFAFHLMLEDSLRKF